MTTRIFATLVLASTSLVALAGQPASTAAQAEPARAGLHAACKTDIARFCQGVQPGGGRIKGCLETHRGELSPGCVQAARQLRQARSKTNTPAGTQGMAQPQSRQQQAPTEKAPSLLDMD